MLAISREMGSTLGHPTAMMRRQAVLEIGKYREQFRYFEDVDLFLTPAERGRLGKVATPLLRYRAQEGIEATTAISGPSKISTRA